MITHPDYLGSKLNLLHSSVCFAILMLFFGAGFVFKISLIDITFGHSYYMSLLNQLLLMDLLVSLYIICMITINWMFENINKDRSYLQLRKRRLCFKVHIYLSILPSG